MMRISPSRYRLSCEKCRGSPGSVLALGGSDAPFGVEEAIPTW